MQSPPAADGPPDVNSPKARFARRTLWLLIASAPFLMILAAAAVIGLQFQLARRVAEAAVKAEVARIQAAGEPMTIEDLYAYHRVPPGTPDTTAAWIAVLKSFDEKELSAAGKALPIIGLGTDENLLRPNVPGSQAAELAQLLEQYGKTLQAAHAAAKLPGECRMPTKFEDGFAMLLPNVQKTRTLCRLEQLELRQRLYEGDIPGTLESVDTMLATAGTLDHQLTLVEQLVRMAIISVALHEVERILNEAQLTEPQLAELQAKVQSLDNQGGVNRGMLGERAIGYNATQHPDVLNQLHHASDGNGPSSMVGSTLLNSPAACEVYLELMAESIEASRAPYPEALKRSAQINDRIKTMASTRNPLERLKYMTSLMMLPALDSFISANASRIAERDLTVAAIAAERYRMETGDYPQTLSQLVPKYLPAVPADPFDGQPLRMKKTEDGLLLYSIGKDGRDNGGTDRDSNPRGDSDVVVTIKAEKGQADIP